jgi:hypothetical protein
MHRTRRCPTLPFAAETHIGLALCSPTQPSMRLQPRHSLAKSFAGLHSAVARSDFAMRVLREMRGMLRGTEGMRYAVVL